MKDSNNNKQQNQIVKGQFRFLEVVSYFIYAICPLVTNVVLVLLGTISTYFDTTPTSILNAIPAFMFPLA